MNKIVWTKLYELIKIFLSATFLSWTMVKTGFKAVVYGKLPTLSAVSNWHRNVYTPGLQWTARSWSLFQTDPFNCAKKDWTCPRCVNIWAQLLRHFNPELRVRLSEKWYKTVETRLRCGWERNKAKTVNAFSRKDTYFLVTLMFARAQLLGNVWVALIDHMTSIGITSPEWSSLYGHNSEDKRP